MKRLYPTLGDFEAAYQQNNQITELKTVLGTWLYQPEILPAKNFHQFRQQYQTFSQKMSQNLQKILNNHQLSHQIIDQFINQSKLFYGFVEFHPNSAEQLGGDAHRIPYAMKTMLFSHRTFSASKSIK